MNIGENHMTQRSRRLDTYSCDGDREREEKAAWMFCGSYDYRVASSRCPWSILSSHIDLEVDGDAFAGCQSSFSIRENPNRFQFKVGRGELYGVQHLSLPTGRTNNKWAAYEAK